VATKAAGFWEVDEETSGRDAVEETDHFGVDPFDKVLVVGLVGGNISFTYAVGSAGAVDTEDSWLFEEAVLEGFIV
jgi:hypothetical protein